MFNKGERGKGVGGGMLCVGTVYVTYLNGAIRTPVKVGGRKRTPRFLQASKDFFLYSKLCRLFFIVQIKL